MLVELGLVEQRYRAVLEVLNDGARVTEVARRYGVVRQTVHVWLRRYAAGGLGSAVHVARRGAHANEVDVRMCERDQPLERVVGVRSDVGVDPDAHRIDQVAGRPRDATSAGAGLIAGAVWAGLQSLSR